MSSFQQTVGIVGATGAVGLEVITCLHRRSFPFPKNPDGTLPRLTLRLFASPRSAGKVISTPYGDLTVEAFRVEAAQECRFVFLAVSGDFALEHAKNICANGTTVVIDNSSAFRYMDDIPLVVPEINADKLRGASLIANPNCTTAIAAVVLWPLHKVSQKNAYTKRHTHNHTIQTQALKHALTQKCIHS